MSINFDKIVVLFKIFIRLMDIINRYMERKSRIYKDILDQKTIDAINYFFDNKVITERTEYREDNVICIDKETNIQDTNSFLGKILLPKIKKATGENVEIDMSSRKTGIIPYGPHTDSHYLKTWERDDIPRFIGNDKPSLHLAILIPLTQGPAFRTVTFNIFDFEYERDSALPAEWLTSSNNLDPLDFSHCVNSDDITKLPVDIDYTWSVGDIFVWPREQLHCGVDFRRYGKSSKEFIIIFSK